MAATLPVLAESLGMQFRCPSRGSFPLTLPSIPSPKEALQGSGITLVAEANEDMIGTYAMLDGQGRFYANAGGRYRHSRPVPEVGVLEAWSDVALGFSEDRFLGRGGLWSWTRP